MEVRRLKYNKRRGGEGDWGELKRLRLVLLWMAVGRAKLRSVLLCGGVVHTTMRRAAWTCFNLWPLIKDTIHSQCHKSTTALNKESIGRSIKERWLMILRDDTMYDDDYPPECSHHGERFLCFPYVWHVRFVSNLAEFSSQWWLCRVYLSSMSKHISAFWWLDYSGKNSQLSATTLDSTLQINA